MVGQKKDVEKENESMSVLPNERYQQSEFLTNLANFITGHNEDDELTTESISPALLYRDPFTCCVMPTLIDDAAFIDGLSKELLEMNMFDKNNDLYKFKQSDDLKTQKGPYTTAFRTMMYGPMLQWMKTVTGIELFDKVDLTCSRYEYTDTLLCHDDELEGRRIAFILYLVDSWDVKDGGALDLFDMDEHGQPRHVVRSLLPESGKFAWFEVTAASHHQVAEVLSKDKVRLSINGWYHGPPVIRPKPHRELPSPRQTFVDIEEEAFLSWINPIYLDADTQGEIQSTFEDNSEIELTDFFKKDKYEAVLAALREAELEWKAYGPPNKRNYKRIVGDEGAPEILKQCVAVMKSEAMFLTLSNLTGLCLHPLFVGNDSEDGMKTENRDDSEGEDAMKAGCSGELEAGKLAAGELAAGKLAAGELAAGKLAADERESADVVSGGGVVEEASGEPARKYSKKSAGEEDGGSGNEAKGSSSSKKVPCCRAELRSWSQGNYTLMHDTDMEGAEFALDALLFFNCEGWQEEQGGYTSYIAAGEDEELLTVHPKENSLALVYRDKETMKFVKHINARSKEGAKHFYDLSISYFEES